MSRKGPQLRQIYTKRNAPSIRLEPATLTWPKNRAVLTRSKAKANQTIHYTYSFILSNNVRTWLICKCKCVRCPLLSVTRKDWKSCFRSILHQQFALDNTWRSNWLYTHSRWCRRNNAAIVILQTCLPGSTENANPPALVSGRLAWRWFQSVKSSL